MNSDIPQEELDKILARALMIPSKRPAAPIQCIQRIICHKASVSDLPADASTSTSVYDKIAGSRATIGSLVSTRRVGPFTMRLVLGCEDAANIWQIVETNLHDGRVVILTYGSEDRARAYAAIATEVDLASDLHPSAHFFGEHRLPRVSTPPSIDG